MKLLSLIVTLALATITPAHAGSPSTTADARESIRIHYSSLVRESAFTNSRVTYWCRRANLRGAIIPNLFLCRTRLYAGSPQRLRVVSDFEISCNGGPFCWIERRLFTWRY